MKRLGAGCRKRLKLLFAQSVLAASLCLLILGDTTAMSEIAKSTAVTARAVGEAAVAGASVIAAGANVTAVVVTGSVSALSTGAGVLGDAWRGVDLVGVEAQRTSLIADAGSRSDMVALWRDERASAGFPLEARAPLQRCAAERDVTVMTEARHFYANGSFIQVRCCYMHLQEGACALAASVSWVRYELQWSNPLWAAVGFDAVTEEAQILRHVLKLLEGLGPSDPSEVQR